MLDAFKKLISRPPPGPDWPEVAEWAQRNGMAYRRQNEGAGFVIEGGPEAKPWRLEWGPPQRMYIQGNELRLRIELGLSQNLQVLLISQRLLELLDKQTFERFTENTQTVIDSSTPEEMRWLVMFPKVPYSASSEVRQRFGLVGAVPAEASSWVEGALAHQMESAVQGLLRKDPPFVLMILRGRVYLRMQLRDPSRTRMQEAIELFEVAILQALRVAGLGAEGQGDWAATGSTAWQTQMGPDDTKPR
jgi:hypothetical protein